MHQAVCSMQNSNPFCLTAKCLHETRNNYSQLSKFFSFFFFAEQWRAKNTMFFLFTSLDRHKTLIAFMSSSLASTFCFLEFFLAPCVMFAMIIYLIHTVKFLQMKEMPHRTPTANRCRMTGIMFNDVLWKQWWVRIPGLHDCLASLWPLAFTDSTTL